MPLADLINCGSIINNHFADVDIKIIFRHLARQITYKAKSILPTHVLESIVSSELVSNFDLRGCAQPASNSSASIVKRCMANTDSLSRSLPEVIGRAIERRVDAAVIAKQTLLNKYFSGNVLFC